jgi:RNA polymerase sigma-70 factor (ECF subfamily)
MDAYEQNRARLFERLLEPHMQRMYRFAFRLTHSQAEAEDLFQDVLTKVFAKLDDLADLDDPGTWLNRVLYNHFVDHRRRYARRRLVDVAESQLPGGSVESLADSSPQAADAFEYDALLKALDALSDEHRTVVLLHDAEGYKLEEIQTITGIPVGTVKSRLHRARARLREILAGDGTFS